eukprot:6200633-Pleurochrysis_carterae.AAC.1
MTLSPRIVRAESRPSAPEANGKLMRALSIPTFGPENPDVASSASAAVKAYDSASGVLLNGSGVPVSALQLPHVLYVGVLGVSFGA